MSYYSVGLLIPPAEVLVVDYSVIDQFSDPSFLRLNQLTRQYPQAVEHIKTAEMDPAQNEKRADTQFADPGNRKFPLDTPGHAALSRIYMEKQAGVSQDVIDNCDKALDLYGISLDLTGVEKVAADDSDDYLLPDIRRLRVKTAADVKDAAEAIQRDYKSMDIDSRARASTNLVKKAVEHNVKLPPQILKFAGTTMCDTQVLRDWVLARTERTTDPNIHYGYTKLAEEAHQMPRYLSDRSELIKVAAAISELDEAAGLGKFYDRTLLDPLSTVFNTEKVADEMMDVAGQQVPLDRLLSLDGDIYRDLIGDDLAAEFLDAEGNVDPEQFQVIWPTVPFDLQKALLAQGV
jgi:hypothetical protein